MTQGIKDTAHLPASTRSHHGAYAIVRVLPASFLLVAAIMNGYSLATGLAAETDTITRRWLQIIGVEFEFILGVLLLMGLWPRKLWLATLFYFLFFAIVSTYKIHQGETTCGCFGRFEIDPRYILGIDLFILVFLLFVRPLRVTAYIKKHKKRQSLAVCIVLALLGLAFAWTMVGLKPATIAANEDLVGQDSLIILEPEKWIGKSFSLCKYIDIGEQLKHGQWTVILYHSDCHVCRQVVPQYQRLARDHALSGSQSRFAFIEVPPLAAETENLMDKTCPASYGVLLPSKDWFVPTPQIFSLTNGQVSALLNRKDARLSVRP
jgi:hypothetical protein